MPDATWITIIKQSVGREVEILLSTGDKVVGRLDWASLKRDRMAIATATDRHRTSVKFSHVVYIRECAPRDEAG